MSKKSKKYDLDLEGAGFEVVAKYDSAESDTREVQGTACRVEVEAILINGKDATDLVNAVMKFIKKNPFQDPTDLVSSLYSQPKDFDLNEWIEERIGEQEEPE